MTLPSDLLILRPCASRTSECRKTCLKGTSPVSFIPIITMRATWEEARGEDRGDVSSSLRDRQAVARCSPPHARFKQADAAASGARRMQQGTHPEEENVVPRLQQGGGVELGQVGGLLRPLEHCTAGTAGGSAQGTGCGER